MAVECRHCKGTGTCSTGENRNSCDACWQKAREGFFPFTHKKIDSKHGLPCGSCRGVGDLQGLAWHLHFIISPVLGVIIVAIVLLLIAAITMTSPTLHAQVLTLLGTLAGSMVGFYFKGHIMLPMAPQTRTPKLPPPDAAKET